MRSILLGTVVALGIVVMVPGIAGAQSGGGGLGACLFFDPVGKGGVVAICADGLDAPTCDFFCNIDGAVVDGGQIPECEFLPGETCDQQKIPWEGACDDIVIEPGAPSFCALLATGDPQESAALCEKAGFDWLGTGSVCGGVPALPRAGYAALALVLMAGTLMLLTLHSRS